MAFSIPTVDMQYETQLLGFSADDLYASVCDTVHRVIDDKTKELGDAIRKNINKDMCKPDQDLDKALDTFSTEFKTKSQGPLLSIRKLFSDLVGIPPHVLLPEDKNHEQSYCYEEEESVRCKRLHLIQQEKYVQGFNRMLKRELKKAEVLENVAEQLNSVKKLIQQLAVEHTEDDVVNPELHSLATSTLGLEVVDASLKLSDIPNPGEEPEIMTDMELEEVIL